MELCMSPRNWVPQYWGQEVLNLTSTYQLPSCGSVQAAAVALCATPAAAAVGGRLPCTWRLLGSEGCPVWCVEATQRATIHCWLLPLGRAAAALLAGTKTQWAATPSAVQPRCWGGSSSIPPSRGCASRRGGSLICGLFCWLCIALLVPLSLQGGRAPAPCKTACNNCGALQTTTYCLQSTSILLLQGGPAAAGLKQVAPLLGKRVALANGEAMEGAGELFDWRTP